MFFLVLMALFVVRKYNHMMVVIYNPFQSWVCYYLKVNMKNLN